MTFKYDRAFAARFTRDEDLQQELLIYLWSHGIEEISDCHARQVVKGDRIDAARKRARRREVLIGPAEDVEENDLWDTLLPPHYDPEPWEIPSAGTKDDDRLLFLRHVLDWTMAVIADYLHVSPSTIARRLENVHDIISDLYHDEAGSRNVDEV